MLSIKLINDDLDLSQEQEEDVALIIRAMNGDGYSCSSYEAFILWSAYSESQGDIWVELPESQYEILSNIYPYFAVDDYE